MSCATSRGGGTQASAEDVRSLTEAATRLLDDGMAATLPPETLQVLTTLAVRGYAARFESGEMQDPVPPDSLTATEVAFACRGLLRAADMQVFELTLWGPTFPSAAEGQEGV